jgi:hypothetical protein
VHLAAWAARRHLLDITIAPAAQQRDAPEEAVVRVDPRVRWPLLNAYRTRIRGFAHEAHLRLHAAPFTPLPRDLRAVLRPGAFNTPRALRLTVTPDVAVEPWEARFVADGMTRRPHWTPRAAPVMWRRSQVPRADRMRSWGDAELLLLAAPGLQPFARRALAGTGLRQSPGSALAEESPAARAALIVGTPVATGSGWRLRLEDEPLSLDASSVAAHDSSDDTFFSPQTAGRLAPFVVIQAPPGGEALVLDQHVAAGLRGFANEASAAGAYAVLAIPPLPPRTALEILRALAGELVAWDERPRTRAVTQLVKELRTIAFEGGKPGPDPKVRLQVAFDICLYVGHERL